MNTSNHIHLTYLSRRDYILAFGLALVLFTSCKSIGPRTIPPDGFNYNAQIAIQSNEQMLFNIVRLRYGEMPQFLTVNSMISQYSRQGNVGLGGNLSSSGAFSQSGSVGGAWSDRPTITYTPLSGQAFSRSFMTPVPPSAIFFLVQSGWSVEVIMGLTINSLNGLHNEDSRPRVRRNADPAFNELLELLGRVQDANALGMHITQLNKNPSVEFFFPENIQNDTIRNAVDQIKGLLDLPPDVNSFPIRYGMIAESDAEIRAQTKSLLEILFSTAWFVEVPPEHIAEGRTFSTFRSEKGTMLNILFTKNKPDNAFVAIKLRDHWYYIDDRDLRSKTNFSILQILMSLTEDGSHGMSPLISIGN